MIKLIVPIMVVVVIGLFIFILKNIFSPKSQAKMMNDQIKTLKSMLEDNKDDLLDLSSMAANLNKDVLERNKDTLKDIATKKANINKDAIEITAEAIKKGLKK